MAPVNTRAKKIASFDEKPTKGMRPGSVLYSFFRAPLTNILQITIQRQRETSQPRKEATSNKRMRMRQRPNIMSQLGTSLSPY